MNNKTLYSIIAIVIILIVGAFVYMQSADETSEQANTDTNNSESMETAPDSTDSMTGETPSTPTSPGTTSEGTFSGETDVTDDGVQVYDISYDGKAYSPANITIKNGDIVRFKNNSSEEFWPASARHPDHLEYPEFDPKKGLAAGSTWEFKFTKTGKWGFHDHLTPSAFGSITVQ